MALISEKIRHLGKAPQEPQLTSAYHYVDWDETGAGQTITFDNGYGTNNPDVMLNGIRLDTSDYTIVDGTDIVFAGDVLLAQGDMIEVVSYEFDTIPIQRNVLNLVYFGTYLQGLQPQNQNGSYPTQITFTDLPINATDHVNVYFNGVWKDDPLDQTVDTINRTVTLNNLSQLQSTDTVRINLHKTDLSDLEGGNAQSTIYYFNTALSTWYSIYLDPTSGANYIGGKQDLGTFETSILQFDNLVTSITANKASTSYVNTTYANYVDTSWLNANLSTLVGNNLQAGIPLKQGIDATILSTPRINNLWGGNDYWLAESTGSWWGDVVTGETTPKTGNITSQFTIPQGNTVSASGRNMGTQFETFYLNNLLVRGSNFVTEPRGAVDIISKIDYYPYNPPSFSHVTYFTPQNIENIPAYNDFNWFLPQSPTWTNAVVEVKANYPLIWLYTGPWDGLNGFIVNGNTVSLDETFLQANIQETITLQENFNESSITTTTNGTAINNNVPGWKGSDSSGTQANPYFIAQGQLNGVETGILWGKKFTDLYNSGKLTVGQVFRLTADSNFSGTATISGVVSSVTSDVQFMANLKGLYSHTFIAGYDTGFVSNADMVIENIAYLTDEAWSEPAILFTPYEESLNVPSISLFFDDQGNPKPSRISGNDGVYAESDWEMTELPKWKSSSIYADPRIYSRDTYADYVSQGSPQITSANVLTWLNYDPSFTVEQSSGFTFTIPYLDSSLSYSMGYGKFKPITDIFFNYHDYTNNGVSRITLTRYAGEYAQSGVGSGTYWGKGFTGNESIDNNWVPFITATSATDTYSGLAIPMHNSRISTLSQASFCVVSSLTKTSDTTITASFGSEPTWLRIGMKVDLEEQRRNDLSSIYSDNSSFYNQNNNSTYWTVENISGNSALLTPFESGVTLGTITDWTPTHPLGTLSGNYDGDDYSDYVCVVPAYSTPYTNYNDTFGGANSAWDNHIFQAYGGTETTPATWSGNNVTNPQQITPQIWIPDKLYNTSILGSSVGGITIEPLAESYYKSLSVWTNSFLNFAEHGSPSDLKSADLKYSLQRITVDSTSTTNLSTQTVFDGGSVELRQSVFKKYPKPKSQTVTVTGGGGGLVWNTYYGAMDGVNGPLPGTFGSATSMSIGSYGSSEHSNSYGVKMANGTVLDWMTLDSFWEHQSWEGSGQYFYNSTQADWSLDFGYATRTISKAKFGIYGGAPSASSFYVTNVNAGTNFSWNVNNHPKGDISYYLDPEIQTQIANETGTGWGGNAPLGIYDFNSYRQIGDLFAIPVSNDPQDAINQVLTEVGDRGTIYIEFECTHTGAIGTSFIGEYEILGTSKRTDPDLNIVHAYSSSHNYNSAHSSHNFSQQNDFQSGVTYESTSGPTRFLIARHKSGFRYGPKHLGRTEGRDDNGGPNSSLNYYYLNNFDGDDTWGYDGLIEWNNADTWDYGQIHKSWMGGSHQYLGWYGIGNWGRTYESVHQGLNTSPGYGNSFNLLDVEATHSDISLVITNRIRIGTQLITDAVGLHDFEMDYNSGTYPYPQPVEAIEITTNSSTNDDEIKVWGIADTNIQNGSSTESLDITPATTPAIYKKETGYYNPSLVHLTHISGEDYLNTTHNWSGDEADVLVTYTNPPIGDAYSTSAFTKERVLDGSMFNYNIMEALLTNQLEFPYPFLSSGSGGSYYLVDSGTVELTVNSDGSITVASGLDYLPSNSGEVILQPSEEYVSSVWESAYSYGMVTNNGGTMHRGTSDTWNSMLSSGTIHQTYDGVHGLQAGVYFYNSDLGTLTFSSQYTSIFYDSTSYNSLQDGTTNEEKTKPQWHSNNDWLFGDNITAFSGQETYTNLNKVVQGVPRTFRVEVLKEQAGWISGDGTAPPEVSGSGLIHAYNHWGHDGYQVEIIPDTTSDSSFWTQLGNVTNLLKFGNTFKRSDRYSVGSRRLYFIDENYKALTTSLSTEEQKDVAFINVNRMVDRLEMEWRLVAFDAESIDVNPEGEVEDVVDRRGEHSLATPYKVNSSTQVDFQLYGFPLYYGKTFSSGIGGNVTHATVEVDQNVTNLLGSSEVVDRIQLPISDDNTVAGSAWVDQGISTFHGTYSGPAFDLNTPDAIVHPPTNTDSIYVIENGVSGPNYSQVGRYKPLWFNDAVTNSTNSVGAGSTSTQQVTEQLNFPNSGGTITVDFTVPANTIKVEVISWEMLGDFSGNDFEYAEWGINVGGTVEEKLWYLDSTQPSNSAMRNGIYSDDFTEPLIETITGSPVWQQQTNWGSGPWVYNSDGYVDIHSDWWTAGQTLQFSLSHPVGVNWAGGSGSSADFVAKHRITLRYTASSSSSPSGLSGPYMALEHLDGKRFGGGSHDVIFARATEQIDRTYPLVDLGSDQGASLTALVDTLNFTGDVHFLEQVVSGNTIGTDIEVIGTGKRHAQLRFVKDTNVATGTVYEMSTDQTYNPGSVFGTVANNPDVVDNNWNSSSIKLIDGWKTLSSTSPTVIATNTSRILWNNDTTTKNFSATIPSPTSPWTQNLSDNDSLLDTYGYGAVVNNGFSGGVLTDLCITKDPLPAEYRPTQDVEVELDISFDRSLISNALKEIMVDVHNKSQSVSSSQTYNWKLSGATQSIYDLGSQALSGQSGTYKILDSYGQEINVLSYGPFGSSDFFPVEGEFIKTTKLKLTTDGHVYLTLSTNSGKHGSIITQGKVTILM
tara:strand:- start:4699 stop:12750 length:8052 start_codon:yes stop_codon:yes gene_type:complete